MHLPKLKLISHKLCPYVQRARVVLAEKAISHEIEFIDLANKPDWFLKISPLGKVPVLLVDDEPIFESTVIMEYLDEITPGSLHPENALARAKNRAWIEFGNSILNGIAGFYSAADRAAFTAKLDELRNKFLLLESQLTNEPWFNGGTFSLVDAVYGPVFRYFDVINNYGDFGFFTDTPKLTAWRKHLSARSSVQTAVVTEYPELLHDFFLRRQSYLTQLIKERAAA
ncbi:MAG: glutathione S-transferase family protein [Gammaproteobacteria bacterium]|nr:glutathione S-transferase family protein [Gammaproteobacteria bacterium]